MLRTKDPAKQLLCKSKNLKNSAAFRTVFVYTDHSVEERAEVKRKVEERKNQQTVTSPPNSIDVP